MHAFVCACAGVRTSVGMYVCTNMHIYACMRVWVHKYTHTCACVCVCGRAPAVEAAHMRVQCHAHTHARSVSCANTCAFGVVRAHLQTHTHARARSHPHLHYGCADGPHDAEHKCGLQQLRVCHAWVVAHDDVKQLAQLRDHIEVADANGELWLAHLCTQDVAVRAGTAGRQPGWCGGQT